MGKKWKIVLALSLIGNLFIVYVAYKALDYRSHVNYFLDKYTYVVVEISGRDKYRDANLPLVSDTQVTNRLVFIGNQLTEHWEVQKYFPSYEAINRGISGQRFAGFLLRFRPDVLELFPKAVIIEFSSYNFRPEYSLKELKDYLICLAELAEAHHIKPILTTVIPTRKPLRYEGYSVLDSVKTFNQWLREYCDEKGYAYVDFYQTLADEQGYLPVSLSASHIEPNDTGYERLANATRKVLETLP